MKFVFAALAMGAVTLAPAQARNLEAAVAPAAPTDVDKLTALIVPDAMMSRIAIGAFDAAINDESKLAPDKKKLFESTPGLKDYVAQRLRPELDRVLRAELPTLRTRLGALFSAEMTPQDITDSLTFFGSNAGKKMLEQMYTGMANSGSLDQEEAKRAGMAAMMASLTPEDYPALMAFGASPAAAKFQALGPKLKETSQAWAVELIAKHGPAFFKLAEDASAEFVAKKKP